MWALLSALFAAVIGFGAGAAGFGNNNAYKTSPVTQYGSQLCYSPETNVKITLKWPDNFVNLTDNRFKLNSDAFNASTVGPNYKTRLNLSVNPPTFNTDTKTCKPMMMTGTDGSVFSTRTYIRVRRNVRISSCKVDELAGPYNADRSKTPPTTCDNLYPFGPGPAAKDLRGSCDVSNYPDLRKVAEFNDGGNTKEVYWVPFTHNAACQFNPNTPNCGPGTTASLKEFVYVIDSRDAFDPLNPSKCVVKWDAGSTDKGACSHFFDVYMAEDLYKKVSGNTPVPTTDPDYGSYDFFKQAIENCHEQNTFIPTFDSPTGELPPNFLNKPFVASNFFNSQTDKILPRDSFELNNYKYFILSTTAINPFKTNLMKIPVQPTVMTINACSPGKVSASAVHPVVYPEGSVTICYVPLGTIAFQKNTNEYVIFRVYSLATTPQTFYLQEASGKDPKVYQYTITDNTVDVIKTHAPALQLNALQFMQENLWTWATPACKPAIYLYPPKETDMSVKLDINGSLTDSSPVYDKVNGWNVTAKPDGTLSMQSALGTNQYPYLYYEAEVMGVNIPKEGFVYSKDELPGKINNLMTKIGFSAKEIGDFESYWIPRLTDKPYYFVTLLPETSINENEKLTFSTVPDSLIRVRFIFEGLDGPMAVTPLANIPAHERSGFVVTDWGAAVVGKSCDQISVK